MLTPVIQALDETRGYLENEADTVPILVGLKAHGKKDK